MDILSSAVVNEIAAATADEGHDSELLATEETTLEVLEESATEDTPVVAGTGPWVLVVTTNGLGKRVPVNQFRLQNRAGMGVIATKFKRKGDRVAALRVVNADDEMMIVTSRGIIIRQAVNAISHQSRMATGVKVQRLDDDDAIFAVALVPPGDSENELSELEEE